MIRRLKIATYRLRPDERIDGTPYPPPRPRPIFERTRTLGIAGWTVHRFRIASVLITVRYRKGA